MGELTDTPPKPIMVMCLKLINNKMKILKKGKFYTKIELSIPNELIENGNYIVEKVSSQLSEIHGKGFYLDVESVILECLENSDLNHDPNYEIERLFSELNEFEKKYSKN
jgi:hypothetical protein